MVRDHLLCGALGIGKGSSIRLWSPWLLGALGVGKGSSIMWDLWSWSSITVEPLELVRGHLLGALGVGKGSSIMWDPWSWYGVIYF